MKILLDLMLVAIIAISVWSGYKKGLVMGIGGILVLVVSILVGNALSNAYSQEVVTAMRPFVGGYTDKLLSESVYAVMGVEESEYSIEDMLAQNPELGQRSAERALGELGLNSDAAQEMAAKAVEYSSANSTDLSDGLAEVVCRSLAFAGAFLLFFVLCAIVLTVIGNLTNLSFRVPYIGSGNELGGIICGLIEGIMLCLVLAWTLRFAGIVFPDGMLEKTWLLSFFMDHNMLASYLGI
ncbi:MAG: CvpA family protein [Candidatus Heteroscillospira sp.]|jgi:hypothetical protein